MDEVVSLSLVLEGLTTEPRHFLSGTGGDVKHGSFWCYVWPPDASLLILRNGSGPKAEYQSLSILAAFSSFWLKFSCIFFGIMDSQPVTAPIFSAGNLQQLPGERRRSSLGDPCGSTMGRVGGRSSGRGAAGSAGTAGEGERYGDGGVAIPAI